MPKNKVKIALTYGDEKGIGLEVLNFILQNNLFPFKDNFEIYLFGDPLLIKQTEQLNLIPVSLNTKNEHSFECLKLATETCLQENFAGLITGSINKAKWAECGHKFKGQTEFLALKCNALAEMLFVADNWRILLLTRHIALKQVPESLTYQRFEQSIQTLKDFLQKYYGLKNPKIALSGLNPHAGENGEIGDEEKLYWQDWAKNLNIAGPFSPDYVWTSSGRAYLEKQKPEYDAYLAPYHDQVLPLIKTITNFLAVNISIGLPFLRTSPDHGTAYDIVGQNKADYKPFLQAITTCLNLCSQTDFVK
jgi:4-hydroxythreonine-4-phosphate dehydrogenase